MAVKHSSLTVKAHRGDAKVLLAFNLAKKDIEGLAGFTIYCEPQNTRVKPYYLYNKLEFASSRDHALVKTEPAYSTVNAPIQKFRWLHVPGGLHNNGKIPYGKYKYTVTPRYFDEDGRMLPLDESLSVTIDTVVDRFSKDDIELGFTRGFVQSQAFVDHFGAKAPFKPKDAELLFDTNLVAGTNGDGKQFTFLEEYSWSGFTAREKIFSLLEEVSKNKDLFLDVLGYDLNEPDILKYFLALGKEGRIRIILDDAALHHVANPAADKKIPPEDQFTELFIRKTKKIKLADKEGKMVAMDAIKRGKFSRFQHNKVFVVTKGKSRTPVKVLSGSTNFSVTGMYVNSNHIIIFHKKEIVQLYKDLFDAIWLDDVTAKPFKNSALATTGFKFNDKGYPINITFAPHNEEPALKNLDEIVTRMKAEKKNILFAVMGTDPKTTGPVAPALIKLHKRTDIFSCGITDSTNDIILYKASTKTGLRVTGKQGATLLPPPFDKEASINLGHQVHHKFIVCGFNTSKAVVWLGSSNLALGGEMQNGDNLIEIRDNEIATVFALEALALVDHFHFRDAHMAPKKKKEGETITPTKKANTSYNNLKTLNLRIDDAWATPYFNENDLHYLDRKQFA
ncbi:MAG: hypothetical protein DI535_00810 [Citrobacter freundii]|nr:MAG: hypothetical protein DI535_00810 [Citrobacter freundii]